MALPHQQRVFDEKESLDAKISSLRNFLAGETFKGLHEDERERLVRQYVFMKSYSSVLGERIAAFT
jgi:hypothetical protein